MNAIIALCHFCEAHGPCAIFCTQTLRDTKIEDITPSAQSSTDCPACNSIDTTAAIVSNDEESNAHFLSTQVPVLPEVAALVKQASVRSLSCEVTSNKDGGFVFFGDASRGHVLSHTFHVSDVQARGFYQLFSIIIVMKDKYLLLNIQPFLSESLKVCKYVGFSSTKMNFESYKKISKELQDYAQTVYDRDQLRGSARERRLSGNQTLSQTPRSLVELTAEKNIFGLIHTHFTWVLLAGSRFLTEHVTFENLPWNPQNTEADLSTISAGSPTETPESPGQFENEYTLRDVKETLGADYVPACFCILTGIKVIIRGPIRSCNKIAMCLRKLLPQAMQKYTALNCTDDLSNLEAKLITVPAEVAVPLASPLIFRVDLMPDGGNISTTVKWHGELPNKLPNLLQKIVKAVDEPLFTSFVLEKHLEALTAEWKNKIVCLSHARSSNDNKLKKVLGIQIQDQALVNYWISSLK